jgi:solute carrier family 26 (sodium-independent sulfate anion transporter), member 11
MIGDIPQGLPPVMLPPFSIPEIRNETTGEIIQAGESFSDMVSSLGSGLIVVPLIALLENIAICKAFANGKAVDATQELIAIGTANIANSFVQGYPGTGALSRGAVNNASGVRTPMGSLYTGMNNSHFFRPQILIIFIIQVFWSFCLCCSSHRTSSTYQKVH